jgi:acetyltransferase-like isoleucine patch superfamily enzyme
MTSTQFKIREAKAIPHYEETHKRTFGQRLRKMKNTVLMLLAYACPTSSVRVWLHRRRGVNIGQNVYIGMFCFLDNLYPEFIYFEDFASVNAGSMALTYFNPMKRFANIFPARVAPVLIKEGAIVTVKSVILLGVTVGKSAIVSAATMVDKDVPDFTIVKGNPMKIIADFQALM